MTDNENKAVRKITSTDLSKSYQKLEQTQSNIYKLSGMTLDDVLCHLAKGDVFVSPDVINRLKAEINRLNKAVDNYGACLESVEKIKAKAIKEFAERLKLKVDIDLCEAIECSDYLYNLPKLIDNLVKEMVGESYV